MDSEIVMFNCVVQASKNHMLVIFGDIRKIKNHLITKTKL